jgi:hypothetical protein
MPAWVWLGAVRCAFPAPQQARALAAADVAGGDEGAAGQLSLFAAGVAAVRAQQALVESWSATASVSGGDDGGDGGLGVCGAEAEARMGALQLKCVVYLLWPS